MLKIPPYKTSENRGWLDVREEGRTHTQLECLYMHTHTHTHTGTQCTEEYCSKGHKTTYISPSKIWKYRVI